MNGDISCPVYIVSQRDSVIARINADRSWSVKWDEVAIQAFEHPDTKNIAVSAICRLLLAARDNFLEEKWDTRFPEWTNATCKVACYHAEKSPVFSLFGSHLMDYVTLDGQWAVDWHEVSYTHAFTSAERHRWGFVAISGFCALLVAAKDNFITVPFPPSTGRVNVT
jgi:hypothetical protein